MNTVQIQCFLEVVRTGSTTEAAKTLHLSQQAISKNLIELEKELDNKLFDRTTRGLAITVAGEYYERLFRQTAQDMSEIGELVNKRHASLSMKLEIGYSIWVDPYSEIQESIESFSKRHPETMILGSQLDNKSLIEEVKAQKIDVAFISGGQFFADRDISTMSVGKEDICLCVPDNIESDKVDIKCFGLPFIHTASLQWSYLEWRSIGSKEAKALGLEPEIIKRAPNLDSVMLDLFLHKGVFVTDRRFGKCRNVKGVKDIPISLDSDLLCIWEKCNENPLIQEFVNFVKDYLI